MCPGGSMQYSTIRKQGQPDLSYPSVDVVCTIEHCLKSGRKLYFAFQF